MIVYVFNPRELRAPLAGAAGLVAVAVWRSEWLALVGLPLVYLGWCGCSPNLNLANGCLPVLAAAITFALGAAVESVGLLAAASACGVTWVAASVESACRCRAQEW